MRMIAFFSAFTASRARRATKGAVWLVGFWDLAALRAVVRGNDKTMTFFAWRLLAVKKDFSLQMIPALSILMVSSEYFPFS